MSLRIVALVAALFVPSAGVARADNPVLTAVVGTNDAFNIALLDANGNRVAHLDAGTYTIQVHDGSTIHQFHLIGPGVDLQTSVEDIENVTWTVTFTDGVYRYQCDPHAGVMKGSFAVGAATLPNPPTQLRGTVGPRRSISLRYADGSKLSVLAGSNSVVLVVTDRSRGDNFHLTGPGVNKKTGIGFRGRVTWKLTLNPGKYAYRSDRHTALRGSFTVSASSYPA
jgi:plastocyanin